MTYFKYLLILFVSLICSCGQHQKNLNEEIEIDDLTLGELNFEVSGSEEAQPHFKDGVLLLHSFEYEDARAEFVKAQEIDPDFVMAYWGEAMTYNHSLWQRQEKEKALAALQKLAPNATQRIALAQTEIEKDFLKGIEILYGEGTKYDRDVAYSQYMEELKTKYPDHHEVSAFYAISLIGTSRNGRDEDIYQRSALIAQDIIKDNPGHPGALHYLIHAYDDPQHAHLAKSAADSYAKVAPDAAHALHMPSHIYLSIGSWDDVVTSNIASWNASIKRKNHQELDNDARGYHALNWLQYGLLQRGEVDAAAKLLHNMTSYTEELPSRRARSYLLSMKGGQMTETNNWEGDIASITVDTEDLSITDRAQVSFIEGMNAFAQQDAARLKDIIDKLNETNTKAALTIGEKGFAMCDAGGYQSRAPTLLDIDISTVMEMQLKARYASLKGDKDLATDWYRQAVELEGRLSYSFGPPQILKPSHEAYAEWLLKEGDPTAALDLFDQALKRNPRRLLSLKGKKLAAAMLQKEAMIASVDEELDKSTADKEWDQIL